MHPPKEALDIGAAVKYTGSIDAEDTFVWLRAQGHLTYSAKAQLLINASLLIVNAD